MSEKRTNPISNTGEVLNKQADNCAKKNKKCLKYALSFVFGVALGVLLGAVFKLC